MASTRSSSSDASTAFDAHEADKPHGEKNAPTESTSPSQHEYPPTGKVIVIVISAYLSMFLVSLDRLIIGTAIPTITNQFNSLDDVGWYGSAYLLTSCAFALVFGRVYTFYNPKWVFVVCIVIFEIGSAISGAAPSSTALIIGRAIAGLGNAGIFQGAVIIVFNVVPLHKRPMYMGFGGLVFGVSSAIGPLLGGVFTDEATWRWCFYINLPIGAITLIVLILVLKIPDSAVAKTEAKTLRQKLNNLDPLGTLVFLPSIICLLLALQWGGITYKWSDFRPILLLVLFGVLLLVFIYIQYIKGETATIPLRIIRNRSILAGIWSTFTIGASLIVSVYFLPIWFQAIKSASAVRSGIMNLPMVLGIVIASILSGIITRKVGYYAPSLIVSAILAPIGIGLITTFTPSTGHAQWIGYQALYGLGLGIGMQQPSLAAQTVLARHDVPTGAALMFFFQTLGGAVFLSVGNNLFNSKLLHGLSGIAGVDAAKLIGVGATEIRRVVAPQVLDQVLEVYNAALRTTFYVALAMSCLSVIGAVAMEWKSVKKVPDQNTQANSTPKDSEFDQEVV